MVLGDRSVRTTLARSWAALRPWNRVRFVWTLLRTGCCVPVDGLKAEVEAMKVRGGFFVCEKTWRSRRPDRRK